MNTREFNRFDEIFQQLGPAGYGVALHISNTAPRDYYTNFHENWLVEYREEDFAFNDPVLQMGQGVKRWSELINEETSAKSLEVMIQSKKYNLNFGGAVVKKSRQDQTRHLLTMARSDRELSDAELVRASSVFEEFLQIYGSQEHLSERQVRVIKLLVEGMNTKEIADEIGLAKVTITKDIEAIKSIWGCKTLAQITAYAVARHIVSVNPGQTWE